ncbi:MAG: nitroreductase family protein [Phycisphaerales bacterium]|nr:MAG: nitroreductase family protein [Phycisphaerales bacterium]
MLSDLVARNRSCRRFDETVAIERSTLEALVDLARLSPSAANVQPLKYILSCDPETNAAIFPHLTWAGYLKDWLGPARGERPSAYIIILGDTKVSRNFGCDHGIAAQSILLGAREKDLAGCMIGLVARDDLRETLSIPARYEILLVLALGKPAEQVVIDPVGEKGDVRYWRDDEGVHHVPKRSLQDLILHVAV